MTFCFKVISIKVLALFIMFIYMLCLKVLIFYQNMTFILLKFQEDTEKSQSDKFSLCGYKAKEFVKNNFKVLDDCLGHKVSAEAYPNAKWLVY